MITFLDILGVYLLGALTGSVGLAVFAIMKNGKKSKLHKN